MGMGSDHYVPPTIRDALEALSAILPLDREIPDSFWVAAQKGAEAVGGGWLGGGAVATWRTLTLARAQARNRLRD